jgi:hypothetical protein
MVKLPAGLRLSALNRKLLRDLWEMKGQGLAIASVIAAGVTMFVTYQSNFDSLQRTRDVYYERQRLADVFASMTRAPQTLETRIRAIPGVETVSTRVVADVTLDVPGLDEPASGRLISIPDRGSPALNDLYLRSGRWRPGRRCDQRQASLADDCRDRAVAGIHLRRQARRSVSRSASLRHLLDGPARARFGFRHGGWF